MAGAYLQSQLYLLSGILGQEIGFWCSTEVVNGQTLLGWVAGVCSGLDYFLCYIVNMMIPHPRCYQYTLEVMTWGLSRARCWLSKPGMISSFILQCWPGVIIISFNWKGVYGIGALGEVLGFPLEARALVETWPSPWHKVWLSLGSGWGSIPTFRE